MHRIPSQTPWEAITFLSALVFVLWYLWPWWKGEFRQENTGDPKRTRAVLMIALISIPLILAVGLYVAFGTGIFSAGIK